MAAAADLRTLIRNPTVAELELIAAYAGLKPDPHRERLFTAFAGTGLPHRRIEAWRWSDVRAAISGLEQVARAGTPDPLPHGNALVFRFSGGRYTPPARLPEGIRVFEKHEAQAFGGAEEAPMAALAAALAGSKSLPGLLIEITKSDLPRLHFVFEASGKAHFARVSFVVRPGIAVEVSESHLGGAPLASVLMEFGLQREAVLRRTVFQSGAPGEAAIITAMIHQDAGARVHQTSLSLGAGLARHETRLVHQEPASTATLNAAYLVGDGLHADITTHVRHGAQGCVTRQITKGAVRAGGRGVFQGKFHVPRNSGQKTDATMQHHALALEEGAEIFARPELEIHADDVQCAHGNTSGTLDAGQLFYMRQRGIPETEARTLLTEAFIAEALSEAGPLEDVLLAEARTWLSR